MSDPQFKMLKGQDAEMMKRTLAGLFYVVGKAKDGDWFQVLPEDDRFAAGFSTQKDAERLARLMTESQDLGEIHVIEARKVLTIPVEKKG